jgi:iron complex outermembrane recepter protein
MASANPVPIVKKISRCIHSLPKSSFFLTAACFFPTTTVYAQDDARTSTLEEIIVTARKTEESIQETPISMAAFNTEALEKIGAFEANAVAKYTPNVIINKQPSSQDNFGYSIRGVGSGETSLAVEPTVGLYMDGVYIARSTGAAFDIAALERIEVLRGPQGTLFGRNTIGGAINIITAKPTGEMGFKQSISAGNRDYLRYSTTIDTPTVGNFAAKLSYMYSERGGILKNANTGGELGQNESEAFRLALRWTPGDDITVDYAFDKSDKENNSTLSQLVQVRPGHVFLGGPFYAQAAAAASANRQGQLFVASDDDDESTSDIDGHALTVEWDVNDSMTFKSITSYREWDSSASSTDFGTFAADGTTLLNGMGGFVPAGQMVSLFNATRVSSQQQFTQEFQLVGDAFDETFNYNVGVYYFEEQAMEDNPQSFVLPASVAYGQLPPGPVSPDFPNNPDDFMTQSFLCADPFGTQPIIDTNGDAVPDFATACAGKSTTLGAPIFVYTTDNESVAIYGEFTYSATDSLDITLGLRYTEDEKAATLRSGAIIGRFGLDTLSESESYSNFSPSITFDYALDDGINVYAKVASGFRAGGYNARATTPTSFQEPVEEETLTSFEVGLKSDWFDRTLRINAAAFILEYKDRQVSQFEAGSGGASSRTTNAGESTTDGMEVEVTWLPTTGMMVLFNYGYIHSVYDEFNAGVVDPVSGFPQGIVADLAGQATVPFAPKQSGSFAIEYTFESWSIGQLALRVDTTYVDESVFHPQLNLFDSVDDYWLLNARASLVDIPVGSEGNFRVSAWGKNLENKSYREWGIDFGALGFAVNSFGELRSYGLDFIYEYN